MASHQLAIAKASFSAGLLRPDPTSVPRDKIEHFHSLLNATITQCTPTNVQTCKQWIVHNIAQSTARFTSLGKYLTALATSFTTSADKGHQTSIKRKRLHVLYLINDLLHYAKIRNEVSIYGKIQPILVGLIASAASFQACPKHQKKILDLLNIWEEKDYYSTGYIGKLRETANNAADGENSLGGVGASDEKDGSSAKTVKTAPFVMPASHGDSSTPWFDLPAANLMPHIEPNSTRPINPDLIRPLKFLAGPADESLVVAVKALLGDVEVIFGEAELDEKLSWDIDELGQPVVIDEITGDVIDGEGYYGWSRSFCERMKRKKKGLDMPDREDERGRLSRSRSSSRSVRKRRHNDSDGSSPDGHRSRQRRRSYSSSRSPTPERYRNGSKERYSRERFRSRSPHRSLSPARPPAQFSRDNVPPSIATGVLPFNAPIPPNFPLNIPPPPMQFQQGFHSNFPPPPPPPPPVQAPFVGQGYAQNYGQGFNSQGPQFGAWSGPPPSNTNFSPSQPWPPPPPPPGQPPPNFQQQFNQQQFQGGYAPPGPGPGWQPPGDGRGYNNGGWSNGNGAPNRGRGNFRGRGRGW